MTKNNVALFGLLPVEHRGELLDASLGPWLDLLDPADQREEPFRVLLRSSDGDRDSKEANDLDEIRELTRTSTSGGVGTGRASNGLVYENLPFSLHVYEGENGFFVTPMYHLSLPWHGLTPDSTEGERNVERTIELASDGYTNTDAIYLYGFASFEPNPLEGPDRHPDQESIERGDVPELHWLNIFPPAVVEKLGRESLLSAPAHRVEELQDGCVLLVVQEYPVDKNVDRWLVVRDHLGLLD